MAALYGRLKGNRGMTTRTGATEIWSSLETWDGSIVTELDRDGTFRVFIGAKGNANVEIATGNIDDRIAKVSPANRETLPWSTVDDRESETGAPNA